MSTNGRVWLALTLLVVALGALGYWQTDWVEKQVDTGYGDEAASNDFLAAEIFLKERGLPVETVTGMTLLDALPSTEHMLFLSASRESLSERRRRALVDWVGRGGELLVVARSPYDPQLGRSEDALLDALGVFLLEPEDTAGGEEQATRPEPEMSDPVALLPTPAEATRGGDESSEPDAAGDEVVAKTVEEMLSRANEQHACRSAGEGLEQVSTGAFGVIALELESANTLAVNESDRDAAELSTQAQVLSLPVGAGRVVAVTSAAPFTNRRIHCHDHAFFLWLAARGRSKLWLLHDPDVPSLGELAWRELPASTAGGLLLILLFGASHSIRFGVVEVSGEAPRRELREHLEASVTFQFRKGDLGAIHERLREDLLRRGPADLERWAERAGVSAAAARAALAEPMPRKRREISKRMRTMLRMRRTK